MGFPILAGVTLGVSAARNFIGGASDRKKTGRAITAIEQLVPRIRSAGAEATGASRDAIEKFREFDALGGFDEELAARVRRPLEELGARSNAAGRFRSGRAAQSEQEVVGREAAQLLTARQRLQLEGAQGLSSAAANFGRTSLDFIGAESEVHSGLADFFQGRTNQRNQELFGAFQNFVAAGGFSGGGGKKGKA